MTEVMLRKQQLVRLEALVSQLALLEQEIFHEQLFSQPNRDRHPERVKAPGGGSNVGFQESFELKEGLIVKTLSNQHRRASLSASPAAG